MTDKLKGLFRGCPHHGDDYEACIQHSGTAPCGVEEERDALAAHAARLESDLEEPAHMQADAYRQAIEKIHPYVEAGKLPASLDASLCRLLKALDKQPRRDARMKAEVLEDFASRIEHLDGLTTGKRMAEEARLMAEGCS